MIYMKLRIGLIGFLALVTVGYVFAIEPIYKIIIQSNSPLEITSYSAKYQKGRGSYSRDGIRHRAEYRNKSGRRVVAVQIGFVSFNVFNEFLDRMHGVSITEINPNQLEKGTWNATALADFSFLTGVAYISKVRFENGEIWRADLEYITEELRKIEEEFDISMLKGTKREQ